MPSKPAVSIIIVAYKTKKLLMECLLSVKSQKTEFPFETIVVDNSPTAELKKSIREKFSKVIYHKSEENLGYGAGNNLGAEIAKGEYLFFLNPDTILIPGVVQELYSFLNKNRGAAIAAPTLLTPQGQRYPDQGSRILTPLYAVGAYSILHKLWPENPLAKSYWMKNDMAEDGSEDRRVEVVPGTAFMIRKNIFDKLGGFDDNFFLYFEEIDLCRRVSGLNNGFPKVVWQLGSAKVKHHWGATTKTERAEIEFKKSRYYYFEKHYGKVAARVIESLLKLGKFELLLLSLLMTAVVLLILKAAVIRPFIDTQPGQILL